jgi:hypothetical protein
VLCVELENHEEHRESGLWLRICPAEYLRLGRQAPLTFHTPQANDVGSGVTFAVTA